ncbi:MAG: hypothetical protein MJY87_07130 [Fibrobacter sp.]|nr:hypothetical protein [Fibrobacter sp.]
MKNKFSLLVSGAVFALMACSSLEVNNPEEENFPTGWSVAEYISVNPDLRALQIMDQVAIRNAGQTSDDAAFTENTDLMKTIAVNYAGFTEATWDPTDSKKLKYLKAFNIYGVDNEPEIFDTMVLDSSAIAEQYVAFGRREGRPYRSCTEAETGLVTKGECQAAEGGLKGDQLYYDAHLYCSKGGVTYCIDCAASDECPVIDTPVTPGPESSAAEDPTPESSAAEETETPAEP